MELSTVQSQFEWPELGHYLVVFGLTMLLEAPFYIALAKRKFLLPLIFCNLATHPFIYWILPWLGVRFEWSFAEVMLAAEVFAPVVEILLAVFVFKLKARFAVPLIILGNLFSWWVGIYLL